MGFARFVWQALVFLVPAVAGFLTPWPVSLLLWAWSGIALGPLADYVHDAIHLLFTRRRWFDRGWPMRIAFAFFGLPFRATLISHTEHHRFSGKEHSRDPELNLGSPLLMIASGLLGIQVRLWKEALRRGSRSEIAAEVIVVGVAQALFLLVLLPLGWKALLFRLVALQIVGGGLIQLRFLLPHYGLAEGGRRDSAVRYIKASRYWDSATLHGVHHQDPSIPTHALRDARTLLEGKKFVTMGQALREVFGPKPPGWV